MDCKDAEALGDLLKVNHYLELIDISNNNIRDRGLLYIVEALILQSNELERRSMLQRSSAIDDDDSLSSIEASQTTDFDTSDSFSNSSGKTSAEENAANSESDENVSDKRQKHATVEKSSDVFSTALATDKVTNENILLQQQAQSDVVTVSSTNAAVNSKSSVVGGAETLNAVVGSLDEMDGDDDTEDTVKSSNHKNGAHAPSGQSMLDKLLSMNSESSSEEGASNLSTDTIAACGSEDASITSDDIFETSGAAGMATAITDTQKSNSSTKAAGGVMAVHMVEGASDIKVGKVKIVEEITLIGKFLNAIQ